MILFVWVNVQNVILITANEISPFFVVISQTRLSYLKACYWLSSERYSLKLILTKCSVHSFKLMSVRNLKSLYDNVVENLYCRSK